MSRIKNTPLWLRALSIIGMLWYAFGFVQFIMQIQAGAPILQLIGFAIATVTGFIGAFFLLISRRRATGQFFLSLIALGVYNFAKYGMNKSTLDELPIDITVAVVTLVFFGISWRYFKH